MQSWSPVLVLLAACAGTPKSPVVASTTPVASPKAPTVSGHVRGAGGRSLRLAHVKLGPSEVTLRPDGTFELPLPEGGMGVLGLRVSAVDHAVALAFIANEHASVTLDVDLGTYPRESKLAPKIALGPRDELGEPKAMVVQADGTYTFDADVPNGAYEYEICGLVSVHCVNGSEGTTWHVDGDGDYASVIEVTNGHVHVVFDPRQLPPPGIDERLSFTPSSAESARVTRIEARMARLARDQAGAMHAAPEGEMPDMKKVRAASMRMAEEAHRDFVAQLDGAKGISEKVTLLACLATTHDQAEADRARRLRALLPPSDPLWGLFPSAFSKSLRLAPDPEYASAFVRESPSSEAVSVYLMSELVRPGDDADHHAKVVAMLKEPRFAGTPAALMASRADASRALVSGKAMPAFSFPSVPDRAGSASPPITNWTFAGKVYLVDVWATWCIPCRASLPKLHELNAKYGKRKDFGFVSVSIDEDLSHVVAFRKEAAHPMPWSNAIAKQSEIATLAGMPGIAVPMLILVDAKGTIIDASPDLNDAKLESQLARLLK